MAEEKQASSEPKGTSAAKMMINVPVEEAWKLLGDFQKIEQSLQYGGDVTVEIVEGENNIPNCVRVVKTTRPDGSKLFANERLLTLDDKQHTCTYQVEENNFGFSVLKGNLKILDAGDGTSVVDWSCKLDTTEVLPIDVAVQLMNEMYVAIIKQAEKIFLQRTASAAPVAAAQEI